MEAANAYAATTKLERRRKVPREGMALTLRARHGRAGHVFRGTLRHHAAGLHAEPVLGVQPSYRVTGTQPTSEYPAPCGRSIDVAQLLQHAVHRGQREPDDVRPGTVNPVDEARGVPLDGVGAGLAVRLARRHVPRDFRGR